MAKFEKHNIALNSSCKEVFDFMSDFRNFERLLPDQIKNWKTDGDSCSFTIEGLAELSMKIKDRYPCSNIHIESEGNNPVSYSLDFYFRKKGENNCDADIVFDVELNPFLRTVASNPLRNFVDMMAEKLKELFQGD